MKFIWILFFSNLAFAQVTEFSPFPTTGTVYLDLKACPAPCFSIPLLPSGSLPDLSVLDLDSVNNILVINATRQTAFQAAIDAAAAAATTKATNAATRAGQIKALEVALGNGTLTNAQLQKVMQQIIQQIFNE